MLMRKSYHINPKLFVRSCVTLSSRSRTSYGTATGTSRYSSVRNKCKRPPRSIAFGNTRINSAGALLAFRTCFEAFPQYIRRPSVTPPSSRYRS